MKPYITTILAIETSCDETSIALIRGTRLSDTNITIDKLSHIVHSQANLHAEFGGVFPALAKREHGLNLVPVMLKVIAETKEKEQGIFITKPELATPENKQAEIKDILSREHDLYENIVRHLLTEQGSIDAIAVTQGPGLEPALWVGINFARALGVLWNVPVVPINHMEGHMISALYDESTLTLSLPEFPVLGLLVSGGHTEIIKMSTPNSYECIGKTRDDAVGEAYDKTARLLGLPYPGGPHISALAEIWRTAADKSGDSTDKPYHLPRPMIHTPDFDFSFSGLKTAVLYSVKDKSLTEEEKIALAGEFDEAVGDVLSHKFKEALRQHPARVCVLGGGVAASHYLRTRIGEALHEVDSEVHVKFPSRELTGDNAFMIALALLFSREFGKQPLEPQTVHREIKARGTLSLSERI